MNRIALDAGALIHQLNDTLRQSTKSRLASNRRIKQTLLQRRDMETVMKNKGGHDTKLLAAAQNRLNHLQQLTRACISAQEADRKSVSLVLHDEIAQGLLGIHVRLLALKKAMEISSASLLEEIGSAQRLVNESTSSVNRFAHDCGKRNKV